MNNLCDTFILSGHQSGSFHGDLVDGHLSPEEFNQITCEFPQLLEGVSSFFLQGCNTMDEDIHRQSSLGRLTS